MIGYEDLMMVINNIFFTKEEYDLCCKIVKSYYNNPHDIAKKNILTYANEIYYLSGFIGLHNNYNYIVNYFLQNENDINDFALRYAYAFDDDSYSSHGFSYED